MPLRSLPVHIIFGVLVACVTVGLGTPAHAGATSVSISPATWTPGSSQAFTLTLQISSGSLRYVGFWQDNGPATRSWTLSQTGSSNGTLSGTTLTCASTGVTYTSSLLTGWGDGVKSNACYDDQDSDYFEIGANIAGASAAGPGTVVISIPAGLLTAPTTVGTTVLQAIANPDPKTNFNAVVAAAAPETSAAAQATRHIQAIGMPVTGSCSDVDDTDLTWGTGLTGSWTPAWGGWLNEGRGGLACSRTLANVSGTQRWIIE